MSAKKSAEHPSQATGVVRRSSATKAHAFCGNQKEASGERHCELLNARCPKTQAAAMKQTLTTKWQTTQADRSSQGGQSETKSHGQMAHTHPGTVRENPLTLVQNMYPQRVTAASTAAVQELLELLNMYEPPPEPVARGSFESQVYVKVKRILKNQKQRAYKKAKKQGFLHL